MYLIINCGGWAPFGVPFFIGSERDAASVGQSGSLRIKLHDPSIYSAVLGKSLAAVVRPGSQHNVAARLIR